MTTHRKKKQPCQFQGLFNSTFPPGDMTCREYMQKVAKYPLVSFYAGGKEPWLGRYTTKSGHVVGVRRGSRGAVIYQIASLRNLTVGDVHTLAKASREGKLAANYERYETSCIKHANEEYD